MDVEHPVRQQRKGLEASEFPQRLRQRTETLAVLGPTLRAGLDKVESPHFQRCFKCTAMCLGR